MTTYSVETQERTYNAINSPKHFQSVRKVWNDKSEVTGAWVFDGEWKKEDVNKFGKVERKPRTKKVTTSTPTNNSVKQMDAIEIIFTLRYHEEHTTGKKHEVAHAVSYAYATGRTSYKLETAIMENTEKLIDEITEKWNGKESTGGVWDTMKEMGF